MNKKAFKRMTALALTGVMAMGTLTGCGGSGDDASKPADNTTTPADNSSASSTDNSASASTEGAKTETPAADDSGAAGIEGWEAFAENVTLKIPVYDRGAEGVPNVSDNYWTKWIQENFGDKYNITVEFVPITRTDVLTSYSLLAAAEDLPTILMEYDYPKQAQWAADGYLTTYDIDEFAKVAPTYYQRMVDLDQLGYTEMNGDRYFVLAERPYYDTGYTFVTFYRKDWLDQIGYDAYPETWAEQKAMYQKLIDEGICEHPLGGHMVTGAGVDQNYAFRKFPLDEENWACYGDYAIPALGDAANKEFIRRENEKYQLGFLNPEYYVTDLETEKASFVSGQIFQFAGYISADVDFLTALYEQDPNAEVAVQFQAEIDDPDGGTVSAYRADNPFGMMIGFSSQATEDEIKAAWMYMEWMTQEENLFTMQWGIEGENYNMGDDGLPVPVADYSGDCKQGFNNSKDYWCVTIEARNAGTIEEIIAASSPKNLPDDLTQQLIDNYYRKEKLAENGRAVSDCNFAVVLDSVGEYQASLIELYTEYRDQLTMCDPEEFDALYDELAQKYADAGFQEIVDERKEAYEAGQSTKLQK